MNYFYKIALSSKIKLDKMLIIKNDNSNNL